MKAYLELRKQVNQELKVILKRDFGVTSFLRIKNGISFEEMRKYNTEAINNINARHNIENLTEINVNN